MANNPNTATDAASAVVDEAVRITHDSARRATDTAEATIAASRRYLDFASQVNRDLIKVWTAAAEASLNTTFEVQNAALANSQTLFDTSTKLTKEALTRWVDVARLAQTTTLKTYESSVKLFGSLTHE